MAKMVSRDIAWNRYYGKTGRDNDAERRKVKRSERNKLKKTLDRGE